MTNIFQRGRYTTNQPAKNLSFFAGYLYSSRSGANCGSWSYYYYVLYKIVVIVTLYIHIHTHRSGWIIVTSLWPHWNHSSSSANMPKTEAERCWGTSPKGHCSQTREQSLKEALVDMSEIVHAQARTIERQQLRLAQGAGPRAEAEASRRFPVVWLDDYGDFGMTQSVTLCVP